jgi:hypothetical protein
MEIFVRIATFRDPKTASFPREDGDEGKNSPLMRFGDGDEILSFVPRRLHPLTLY